jgi:hypothetical protein
MLWLMSAAVIPLIIHLFSRRKPRVVPFPGVQFILRSKRRSHHRLQIKHLLLILLRMALICLFALIIARPVLRGPASAMDAGAEGGPRAAVLVLDDSLSMRYREGDRSSFDTGRNRALELVQSLPTGVYVATLLTGRPQGDLADRLDSVVAAVRGSTPSPQSNSCWRALRRAADILQRRAPSHAEVYVFTDMTPSAWAGYQREEVNLGERTDVYIVDCSAASAANAAVLEIRHEGEPPMPGARFGILARLLASGGPAKKTVEFSFDGDPMERREVQLGAGEEATLRFSAILRESGHHWGQVRFRNPDGLPEDDCHTFTVEAAQGVSVLCVEDDVIADEESPSYFLRLALNPWQSPDRGIFRIERAATQQIRETSLAAFDVVALIDAGMVGADDWEALAAYVADGGGLLVFLGPRTADAYTGEIAASLLGVKVDEQVSAPPNEPFRFRTLDTGHPLVNAIRQSGADMGRARFRECRRMEPGEAIQELLSFGPDLPALVLSSRGGRVAVLATPPDERWGVFAELPLFVPFCHETLLYLSRRGVESIRSYVVGSDVPISYAESQWPTVVRILPPGASEPERPLAGAEPGQQVYRNTLTPGYYAVDFAQHEKRWKGGFAVNAAAIESWMDPVAVADLEEAIQARSVETVTEARFGENGGGGAGRSAELTPYLVLAALALLVLECFLANRFYGTPPAQAAEE